MERRTGEAFTAAQYRNSKVKKPHFGKIFKNMGLLQEIDIPSVIGPCSYYNVHCEDPNNLGASYMITALSITIFCLGSILKRIFERLNC